MPGCCCDLADEAKDEATAAEADAMLTAAEDVVSKLEFARMLSGPYDRQGALLSINAGAGGTESQDWAEMLQRMYTRWAQRRGYELEVLDLQPGDEAGIKSVTLGIQGEWAYGYLRAEAGVHRLVRISPFDSQARRHTSFASVFVYPDIDETVHVDIDEKDLRVETMRSGGAGGQHVNKTESAIRITHVPTGIAVHCQSERSQHKNRSTAMRILRSKLMEIEERKMEEKMGGIHAAKKAIEWGSQIRCYVLAPYRLASDHRTEIKLSATSTPCWTATSTSSWSRCCCSWRAIPPPRRPSRSARLRPQGTRYEGYPQGAAAMASRPQLWIDLEFPRDRDGLQ